MITCKVGNTIINCIDDIYDKEKLKMWSNQDRLICPDCGKLYEYCHGKIVSPYFRHKEKSSECDGIYHESETEEHIKGKTAIYKWLLSIKDECGIENIHLEYYIKETRQKPDIYFEQNGERYAIEYQCTPIATEFLERRELYKLAGIKDIWVLGCDKYTGRKVIEEYVDVKFDAKFNHMTFGGIRRALTHQRFFEYMPNSYPIDNLLFKNEFFNIDKCVTDDIRNKYVQGLINRNIARNQYIRETIIKENKFNAIKDVADLIKSGIDSDDTSTNSVDVSKKPYASSPYDFRLDFENALNDKYVVFIKPDRYDMCIYDPGKYRMYRCVLTHDYNTIGELQDSLFDDVFATLKKSISMKHFKRCANVLSRNKEKVEKCISKIFGVNVTASMSLSGLTFRGYRCDVDMFLDIEKILYDEDMKILSNYVDFEINIKREIESMIKTEYTEEKVIDLLDHYNNYNVARCINIQSNVSDHIALLSFIKKDESPIKFNIHVDMESMTVVYKYVDRTGNIDCDNFKTMYYAIKYLINRFANISN